MKRVGSIFLILILSGLCGCIQKESSQTRFVFDTVATVTAECDDEIITRVFSLCEDYERLLSRTIDGSDVYRINNSEGFVKVSQDTIMLLNRAIYYSRLSEGSFDVTIYPVSQLWDFKNQVIPQEDEIAQALKRVNYQNIEIKDGFVNSNQSQIDLGGIAKGYIADKVLELLKDNGVKKGIINLGGNVIVFGETYKVGIAAPFKNENAAIINVKDKSVVTSGIYQRYIKEEEQIYHHIIDVKTGYGVENSLASVTVIGDCSLDCDALSTVCMLLGKEKAEKLIESVSNTEAVFIDRDGNLSYTDGIYKKNKMLYLK